jgi:hypothetical protein
MRSCLLPWFDSYFQYASFELLTDLKIGGTGKGDLKIGHFDQFLAILPSEMYYALVPTTLVRLLFSIRIFWAINRPQNHWYWEGRSKKRSFWPVFGPLNPLNEKCAHPHYPGSILIFNTHLLSYRPSSKSLVSYHFVAILAKYGYFWVSPRKFEILHSFLGNNCL